MLITSASVKDCWFGRLCLTHKLRNAECLVMSRPFTCYFYAMNSAEALHLAKAMYFIFTLHFVGYVQGIWIYYAYITMCENCNYLFKQKCSHTIKFDTIIILGNFFIILKIFTIYLRYYMYIRYMVLIINV